MSSTMRITGMATGMDTDNTIKQMMKPYNMKLDKMKQDKQIVQWRQDLYRDIISDISALKSKFLDYTKPSTNMLSTRNYAGFDISTDSTGSVSLTADNTAVTGNYSIKIDKLASGAKVGGGVVTKGDGGVVTTSTKLSDLTTPVGGGDLYIVPNGGDLITINVDPNGTIGDLVNNINNNSNGKLTARYSELTKQFTIETKQTGEGATLEIANDPSLQLAGLGITTNLATGVNADITITPPGGVPTQVKDKTTNNFTVDGITYNLQNTNTVPSVISVNKNVQPVVDKIKEFVTKYNEIIDKVTTKIEQKSQKTYLPLTDEQKKEMSEEEITKWEDKAKEGILRNDSILRGFTEELRSTLYKSVQNAGISLSDELGLGTSSDQSMRGKLVLDEEKLKSAIEKDGEKVIKLFTQSSTSHPTYSRTLTNEQKQTRINEEGIFQRISDVIQEYTSTYRDANGKKGIMLEKSGVKGDISEINNLLYKDLANREKQISEMQRKLADKENRYYLQFSKLEQSMQKYNSQSSWLSQQLGGA